MGTSDNKNKSQTDFSAKKSRISDIMVSIRMPVSLVAELRQLSEKRHFLDLSEQIRSIVRQKWNFHSNPQLELRRLRESIEHEIRKRSAKKVQEEVAKELEMIKNSLAKKGF